jgi:hypothetical protein
MSFVVPSEYMPVAVNCCVVPLAILGFVGVTLIELNAVPEKVALVFPAPQADRTDASEISVTTIFIIFFIKLSLRFYVSAWDCNFRSIVELTEKIKNKKWEKSQAGLLFWCQAFIRLPALE